MTNESDPTILNSMAKAYHRTGDYRQAVQTQKKALKLLPEGGNSALRKELEANLKEFKEALDESQ